MKKIDQYHWLHPVFWICWIILIKYGAHLLFWSGEFGIHFLLYSLVPALFAIPVLLFHVKPLYFYQRQLNWLILPKYKWAIAVYLILLAGRLSVIFLNGFWYGSLKSYMPAWFYFLIIIGWLASYFLITQLFSSRKNKVAWLVAGLEFVLILGLGFREWLIIYGMGILAVVHLYRFYVNKRWLVYAVAGFLLVISPLILMTRYVQYELKQSERQTPGIIQTALGEYPEFVSSSVKRLGGEGLILEKITGEWARQGWSADHSVRELGTELRVAATPRLIWEEKPELRPGEAVYETYIDSENPHNYTYPSGLLGDLTRYFGWWSLLVIPLLSMGLIYLWNNLFAGMAQKTLWLGLHYFYFHIFYDTHLVFWATSWLRDGLVYASLALIGYLMINYFKD